MYFSSRRINIPKLFKYKQNKTIPPKVRRHRCPSCPINDTLYNGVLTTLWQQFGENHFPVSTQQYPLCIVPRTNVVSENGMGELGTEPRPQPHQTPLNWGIVCKPGLIIKTSIPKLTNALEAGSKIPKSYMENLPRREESVAASFFE